MWCSNGRLFFSLSFFPFLTFNFTIFLFSLMATSDSESLQDELQGSKVFVSKLANPVLRSSSSAASLSSRPGRHWKRRSSADSSELSATTPGTFSVRGDTVSESNADLVVPRVTIQENHPELPECGEIGHLRVIVCGDSGIALIMQHFMGFHFAWQETMYVCFFYTRAYTHIQV